MYGGWEEFLYHIVQVLLALLIKLAEKFVAKGDAIRKLLDILLSKVKEKCVLITVANVLYWLFIGVVGNSKCNKQRVYEGERKSWLSTCVICCIFSSETKYLSRQFYFSGISYLTLLKRRVI